MRRGLAVPAVGILPPESWAFNPDVPVFDYDPAKARALLDEAGYPDPDGDGPAARLHLTLKTSTVEFFRLQATVIQQHLQAVGVDLEVRTLRVRHALRGRAERQLPDVLAAVGRRRGGRSRHPAPHLPLESGAAGRLQSRPLQRSARRSRRSTTPRGRPTKRSVARLFGEAQRLIAEQVPYISLWCKTNAVVAPATLDGLHVTPIVDFCFLKDVSRRYN